MPEGHLVHHHARRHAAGFAGLAVHATSPQGRVDTSGVDGRAVTGVEAHGKWELVDVADGPTVAVHLGQRGLWLHADPPPPEARPQVRLRFASERLVADLIAPMRCDLLDDDARRALVEGLGDDPLRRDADPERVWLRMAASAQPIGTALLDQSLVAGVGNVLRAEVLALCRLDPHVPARDLTRARFDLLWATLVDLMERSAVRGRILTLEDRVPPDGDVDEAATRLVYRRTTCGRCGAPVREEELGRRTLWACPRCQRAAA